MYAEYDKLGLIMRAVCVIVSFTLGSTGQAAFHRYRTIQPICKREKTL